MRKQNIIELEGREYIYRGKQNNTGYILVVHPRTHRTVYLHRAHYEMMHNVELNSNEVVHHIDCNPNNNTIANLKVMTLSEHMKLHKRSLSYNGVTIVNNVEIKTFDTLADAGEYISGKNGRCNIYRKWRKVKKIFGANMNTFTFCNWDIFIGVTYNNNSNFLKSLHKTLVDMGLSE